METVTRQMMLERCEAIDRAQAAVLAEHPNSPRYCYTCQQWLDNQAATAGHTGHSIH